MATGDLTNNIRKLQKELKIMKYQESLDLNGLAQGKASALLPIYHYAFTTYSCSIAELIASTDTELYTKTDLRFMEGCYKILRDLFHYKPPVTKEQFFNNGFVERKIIMCTEVMKLIQQKNKSLQPQKKALTTTTSNLGQVVSMKPSKTKVTDLTQVRPNSSRRSRSSLDTYSSQREGQPDPKNVVISPRSLTDVDHPQVVNELLQPAENIPRHTAHHGSNKLLDNHPLTEDAETSSSSESSDQVITQRSPPVHVASVTSPPRVTKEVLPSAGRNVRGFNWAVVTPSIAKTRSSIPFSSDIPGHAQFCLEEDEEDGEEEEEEDGIETVMAATPAHSIMEPHNGETIETERNHNSNPQQPQTDQASQQMLNETHILKAIEQLTKCFGTLESGLTRSIESLNARMILVENRVSMMESKIEAVVAGSQRIQEPVLPQPTNHNIVSQRSAVSGGITNLQGQGQQNYNITEITRPPSSSTVKSKAEDNPITVSGQERTNTESPQITTNQTTEKSPKYKAPPYQSALYDDSTLVMFSPIRHVAGTPHQQRTPETTFCSTNNDTSDPRRSSTPEHNTVEMDTQIVLGESMNLPTGDTDTQSQVNRIKNLFKSTEVMLKN